MVVAINRLEFQVYEKLPSQPESNLKNVNAMTLRSRKEIQGPELVISKDKNEDRIEKELEDEGMRNASPKVIPDSIIRIGTNSSSFPSRLEKPKKQDKEKEILEVFARCLCVNKKKLRGDEHIVVGGNVSVILQKKLPTKCGDPGHLKEIEIIIQLVDYTFAYPDGVVENVLVQVDELIFPANFYVLYMDDGSAPNPSPIILGRPFLSTAQTKIDISNGTLTMKFDGEIVHFNIFDIMKYPVNSHSVFAIHAINHSVQEFSEFACRDKSKVTTNKYQGMKAIYEVKRNRKLRKKTAFNGYLDLGGEPPITRKIELHPD
ncbi:uncharacterized protein [Coffea arabica]|uniref:Uncharacterized protein n=1 Tax=Coffea arabica TaxID=13443 RepID=A0ABM4X5E6_COFAR